MNLYYIFYHIFIYIIISVWRLLQFRKRSNGHPLLIFGGNSLIDLIFRTVICCKCVSVGIFFLKYCHICNTKFAKNPKANPLH